MSIFTNLEFTSFNIMLPIYVLHLPTKHSQIWTLIVNFIQIIWNNFLLNLDNGLLSMTRNLCWEKHWFVILNHCHKTKMTPEMAPYYSNLCQKVSQLPVRKKYLKSRRV